MTNAESGVLLIWLFSGFIGILLLDSTVWEYQREWNRRHEDRFSRLDEPNEFGLKTLLWAALLGSIGGIFILPMVFLMEFGFYIQKKVLKHDVYRGFSHDL